MTDELQIWALDGAGEATQVAQMNRAESELALEETLVNNPEMLMPDLELVGRQTPTAGGPLDLLGVDREGSLVVFELKRGALTRDAVTQVIDYCSSLDAMADSDLALHIAERSGNLGIASIEDFEEWYAQRFNQPIELLRPTRMALVGIGADENAIRMVNYLRDKGVSIALMTFYGYQHNGQTLLARQVQAEPESAEPVKGSRSRQERREARRAAAAERIAGLGMQDFWDEVVAAFEQTGRYASKRPLTDGFTFSRRTIRLPDYNWGYNAPLSVRFTSDERVRITFFPISVHLCKAQFEEAKQVINFQQERPSNASTTNEVKEQWHCALDRDGWATHKEQLIALVSDVYKAWSDAARSMGEE